MDVDENYVDCSSETRVKSRSRSRSSSSHEGGPEENGRTGSRCSSSLSCDSTSSRVSGLNAGDKDNYNEGRNIEEIQKLAAATSATTEACLMDCETNNATTSSEDLSSSDLSKKFVIPGNKEYEELLNSATIEDEVSNLENISEEVDVATGPKLCYFKNYDATLSPSPFLHYILEGDERYDTVLCCADGRMGAHRMVLVSCSPYMASFFHHYKLGEVAVMILPDIKLEILRLVVIFMYRGNIVYPEDKQADIMDLMQMLLIGQYGNLSQRKVEVKEPIPEVLNHSNLYEENLPGPSSSNSTNHVYQDEIPSLSHQINSVLANAGLSTNRNRIIRTRVTQFGSDSDSPSSNEEDAKSGTESDAGHKSARRKKKKKNGNGGSDNHRVNMRNSASVYDRNVVNGLEYSYVIESGKLRCAHCPGCFKSLETLSKHLDETHGVDLCEVRPVDKVEWHKLIDCGYCSKKHDNISAASNCLQRHRQSRCYICFDTLKHEEFEGHMKTHGKMQPNKTCIVACLWCEAGIIFESPYDNKAMSNHCYRQHFATIPDSVKNSRVISIVKDSKKDAKSKNSDSASSLTPFPIFSRAKSSSSSRTSERADRRSVCETSTGSSSVLPYTPKPGSSSSKTNNVRSRSPSSFPSIADMVQGQKLNNDSDSVEYSSNSSRASSPEMERKPKRIRLNEDGVNETDRGAYITSGLFTKNAKDMKVYMNIQKLPIAHVKVNRNISHLMKKKCSGPSADKAVMVPPTESPQYYENRWHVGGKELKEGSAEQPSDEDEENEEKRSKMADNSKESESENENAEDNESPTTREKRHQSIRKKLTIRPSSSHSNNECDPNSDTDSNDNASVQDTPENDLERHYTSSNAETDDVAPDLDESDLESVDNL